MSRPAARSARSCVGVDTESGAIVLEHGPHGVGVGHRLNPLGMILPAHPLGVVGVPGERIGVDRPFGLVGHGEEEPVVPGTGEALVAAIEVLDDGHSVEDDETAHTVGVVQARDAGRPGRHGRGPTTAN